MCLIGLERAVSPEECICKFINKPTMVVHPKKAYDEGRRTAVEKRRGDPDLNAWQPVQLFLRIASSSGCSFDFTAVFISQEQAEERKGTKEQNASMGFKKLQNKIREDILDQITVLDGTRSGL